MRIALNNPPVYAVSEPWYDTPDFGRTGLAYVAGHIRTFSDYEISIIDSKFERLGFEQTVERLRAARPDVVGFTAFTNEIKPAARVARMVKEALGSEVVTVIGGVHQTALPAETLQEFPEFDYGVNGEGEATFLELCRALERKGALAGIRGLSHREGAGVIVSAPRERTLELDAIPFPAWDLMPPARTYYIQTARGCPFACKFCMNPNGKFARQRSVENTIEELKLVVGSYRPETIWFGDEIFTVDVARTKELLRAIIAEGIHKKIRWAATTHVRFVDDELFGLMRASNVFLVGFGIETGDEETLKTIGKGTNVDMILRAREGARRAKVPITTYCILGQPNETVASIHRTIDLAVRLNPDLPIFGIMVPYPGTDVALMAARGLAGYRLLTTDWDDYNKQIGGALSFAGLSRTQIEILQLWAYVKVFIWNFRFLDLAKFAWEWRGGGWSVVKKIARGIAGRIWSGPGAEEARAVPQNSPENVLVDTQAVAEATEGWQKWQITELVRAKKNESERNRAGMVGYLSRMKR